MKDLRLTEILLTKMMIDVAILSTKSKIYMSQIQDCYYIIILRDLSAKIIRLFPETDCINEKSASFRCTRGRWKNNVKSH